MINNYFRTRPVGSRFVGQAFPLDLTDHQPQPVHHADRFGGGLASSWLRGGYGQTYAIPPDPATTARQDATFNSLIALSPKDRSQLPTAMYQAAVAATRSIYVRTALHVAFEAMQDVESSDPSGKGMAGYIDYMEQLLRQNKDSF